MSSSPTPGLTRFNTADDSEARAVLREVCASQAWGSRIAGRRPYATTDALLAASDAATAELTAEDLAQAMAGHPPIGRPEPGDAASAREQSGMAGASEELRAEMLALNLAYQERFGHVFLICATGLTGEQMRDAVRHRLGNSPERERETVRTELGKINRIRLARLVADMADMTDTARTADPADSPDTAKDATRDTAKDTAKETSVSTHILDTSAGRPAEGVALTLSVRSAPDGPWSAHGASKTDADGRCKDLPALPEGTTHVRLEFATGAYLAHQAAPADQQAAEQQDAPRARDSGAFFPEVAVTFAVNPGEHHHVPLLLNPFGYSVYRGS
ncbi:2-oxo-4-hydroxy-4-carboxy-5-ureidoimidazoline decarboxylase [Streptomyces sp. MST-110588]|uniref:2-oxo-4-hydroxy-4-carboxy-5-ureidoimidazoline decarboxylase n=1 Tax=Streptomyces sp. MST-110588 TaxID=2833628 RepID=UPI001F5CF572|nr:2-oxo-4-hydroxy-4-carboxy-5-ureidoimidazoline decarboxylase [Streptomyces sp. MST-110588]UNO39342.1 2-oxo-4-hydroxy-4-carboxy-5-ureidoimidazoline decarboxylase [Streptomyces sp. MST-110588]